MANAIIPVLGDDDPSPIEGDSRTWEIDAAISTCVSFTWGTDHFIESAIIRREC
jgi:hypothetical protein